jgi:hypothetical protein
MSENFAKVSEDIVWLGDGRGITDLFRMDKQA